MNVVRFGLVSALVCVLGISAARAEVVYLSNAAITNLTMISIAAGDSCAQRFQAGNDPGGFALESVKLKVSRGTGSTGTMAVMLRSNSATNTPGAVLASLSGSSPTGGTLDVQSRVYSAPSGIILQQDKTYWISVEPAGGSFLWGLAGTNYNVFDAQDGWAFLPNGNHNLPTSSNRPFHTEIRCRDAVQYFQDFSGIAVGATTAGDGSTLSSTSLGTAAEVQDGVFKSLQLTTSGVANTRSAFRLPDLDPGAPVNAFSVKWLAEVYGNFPTAGEGWSVNFGQIGGLSLTSTVYEQESGYDIGLTLSVETATNNPGIYLLVNGITVASSPLASATRWGVNSTNHHFFEWDWHGIEGATLRMDGQTIFSGVSTYGFIPASGDRFVWAARTGTTTERIRLDNILVATGGNLKRQTISTPYVSSPGSLQAGEAFDGDYGSGSLWADYDDTDGYVGGKLSTQQTIRVFAVTSGGTDRGADPLLWSLEGSNDGGTNFSTCMSSGGLFRTGGMTLCAPSTNAESYDVFRLFVSTNNGNGSVTRVAELTAYSFSNVAAPAAWKFVPEAAGALGYGTCIAISSDDARMLAGFWDGNLHRSVSNDSVWTTSSGTDTGTWYRVRIAGNGQIQFAMKFPAMYRSSNYGASFTEAYGPVYWDQFDVSENGQVLAAVNANGATYLNYSTDSGFTWPFATGAKVQYWSDVAVSADGTYIVATSDRGTNSTLPGNIWLSTNTGSTWAQTTAPSQRWQTVAISDDGLKIYAAATNASNSSVIYISTNGGTSWQQSTTQPYGFDQIECSSDGLIIAAHSDSSSAITISQNGGQSWSTLAAESAGFFSEIALSGDGGHIAAIDQYGTYHYRFNQRPPTITDRPVWYSFVSQAGLRAYVNPNGLPSTAWVALGPTPAFGQTNVINVGSGTNNVSIDSPFTNLNSGTTYYYRFFATNRTGVIRQGDLLTFNTPQAEPAGFSVSLNGPQITGVVSGSFYGIYFIQHSPSLLPPAWQTIATNYNGFTNISAITVNLDATNGFYRAISK